jgi:translation initiation factor IF-2
MAKMKVFELKNHINDQIKNKIESKDIIDFIETNFGVKKSHSSNLEDNEVIFINNYFVHADKVALQTKAKTTQPAARQTDVHAQSDSSQSPETQSASADVNTQSNAKQAEQQVQHTKQQVQQQAQQIQHHTQQQGQQQGQQAQQHTTTGSTTGSATRTTSKAALTAKNSTSCRSTAGTKNDN